MWSRQDTFLECLKMFWVAFCPFSQQNCLKTLKKSQDLVKPLIWSTTPASNSMFDSSFVPFLSVVPDFKLHQFPLDSKTISGLSVVAVITQSHIPWCTWACWSYAWVKHSPCLWSGFRILPNPNKRLLCKVLLLAGDDPGADGICYRLQKLLMKPTLLPMPLTAAVNGLQQPPLLSELADR